MLDLYQRKIDYMRISITDRCHFQCAYCKNDHPRKLKHQDILSYEQLLLIVDQAIQLGITKFKITGGEPTIRKDYLFFIKELKKRNIKMAIVSNKNMDAVRELNEIYFSEYISLAVGDTAGVRRKPYPDSVLHAMQLLDSRKEHTVYVGDSEVDKETAENAGMDYVLVSWGFRGREYLEKLGASCIIDRPEELISMLEIAKEK